ncbi:PREDICTED: cell division control protein 6 homolog [Camelina sativa]|uniref:Cell division control protein 6 homolog n=1 Tax=Camelina sativa TaxID=90675 RepID=A0ABM1Q8G7_CAMSA|nr:PREDICTED: cell division control protein 6 homolog [Camelina sativa]
MLQIYVTCGEWKSFDKEWKFIVDEEKCARLLTFQSTTTLEYLKLMVSEDYTIEHTMVDVEFSYLPIDLGVDSPPVLVKNERQLKNFVDYFKRKSNIRLCVTFTARGDNQRSRVNTDLNEKLHDSTERGNDCHVREKTEAMVNDQFVKNSYVVGSRLEVTGGLRSAEVNTCRKRKLRSDSAAEVSSSTPVNSISTPMKWKSPRRCAVSIPKTSDEEIKEDSNGNLASPVISVVKNLDVCLDVESKWNPRDEEQMKAVKEALHVSKAPSTVVCREDEQRRVFEFVKGCMEQNKAGSLYICGCPGTGKSLSMEKVRQQAEDWAKQTGVPCLETVSVNCTSLTKSTDIFSKILGKNESGREANGSSSPLQQLQSLFSQKQQQSSSKMM